MERKFQYINLWEYRTPTFISFTMPRVKLFDEKEVLTKAMNLFWKQGYSATSIQDLVKHLGINRASLYDTYGGKEQLFYSAFQQYRHINTENAAKFLETQKDTKTGLKKLFAQAIEESLTDEENKGCFVVNTTTELIPGDSKMLGILEENKETFKSLFYNYLKKGESEGLIKKGKDLMAIATLLFTLYNGLKVVSKVKSTKSELTKSVNLVLTLLD